MTAFNPLADPLHMVCRRLVEQTTDLDELERLVKQTDGTPPKALSRALHMACTAFSSASFYVPASKQWQHFQEDVLLPLAQYIAAVDLAQVAAQRSRHLRAQSSGHATTLCLNPDLDATYNALFGGARPPSIAADTPKGPKRKSKGA